MNENLPVVEASVNVLPVKSATPVVKISKLSILRKLLSEKVGYTKTELAEKTGLKLSTVNCQLYYHLPTKGFTVEKLENKKVRFTVESI